VAREQPDADGDGEKQGFGVRQGRPAGDFRQWLLGPPRDEAPAGDQPDRRFHYLQALDAQRKANQAVAILGGKTPHIQNLAVGGVANAINLDDPATLNMEKIYMVKDLLAEVTAFVQQVYLPDVCVIGAKYAEWLKYGAGVTNYLAVPDLPLDTRGRSLTSPGDDLRWKLETYKPISSFQDPYFKENVSESIARSYYDGEWEKHPWEEATVPKAGEFIPSGSTRGRSPAVPGAPDAVGPLAQVLMGYAAGHEPTMRWGNRALETASKAAGAKLGPSHLHSTLGRHLARAVRCAVLGELAMKHWQLLRRISGRGTSPSSTRRLPPFRTEGVRLPRGSPRNPIPLDRDEGR